MAKKLKVRYYRPRADIALDISDIQNFVYDMSRCIKCKGCTWVDHTYMPGARFMTRCPSAGHIGMIYPRAALALDAAAHVVYKIMGYRLYVERVGL